MSSGNKIHQRISSLELGISRQEALDIIQYQPDFSSKSIIPDGGFSESLVYKRHYCRHIYDCTPYIYTLLFENNKLVVVDIQEDIERLRLEENERIFREREAAADRRAAAIISAQKEAKKENKD